MNYCKNCGVYVRDGKTCPLCFSALSGKEEEEIPAGYPYLKEYSKAGRILMRIFLLLVIAGCLACFLLNLLFWNGVLWSLVVASSALLLWATMEFIKLGRKNIGLRVMGQMFSVVILLITIDVATGWRQWSIGIVVPFVIIASTLAITIVLYVNRKNWREYMIYQFIITLNGFLPVILYFLHFSKILWPGVIGAFYSILTFLGILIFANKQFTSEVKKRFHI
jgi:hypothetical protein